MLRRSANAIWLVTVSSVAVLACGGNTNSPAAAGAVCGGGTVLVGDTCVPADAGATAGSNLLETWNNRRNAKACNRSFTGGQSVTASIELKPVELAQQVPEYPEHPDWDTKAANLDLQWAPIK